MKKKFYRELGKKSIEINEPPKIDEVESLWGNIWEKQKSYNENAGWLDQIETENIEVIYQVWPQITLEETKSAIKKASNWKCPGKDGIANFCIKNLPSLHQDLTNAYDDCICNPVNNWHYLSASQNRRHQKSKKIIVQSHV